MGRKLDLSSLSDNEAEHVLQVVQRDMKLRKQEEERLSELKQELDEEGSRCLLLSRQGFFNQRCCIRCCSPFTFLLNPKRKCRDCKYNVCKACRVYCKREKAWLCSSCEKGRLLKTQNLEWFYTNVKTRFKRFGSAKVLKTLYRKHLVEHRTLLELSEGSTFEDSIGNEGSICGSDSAFYRQSEEHSMEETLTVALRVAEEAIDEAIAKAEFDPSQERQNEAHYLREHKGELVEELAKTIVQKIISRRKTLAERRGEYVQDWPVERSTDLHHRHQPKSDRAASSVKQQPGLFRSHSAFSLLENDSTGLSQESSKGSVKEGGAPAMTTWKSVDRLDNAGVSAVLHSMDGNWIALQSAQLSRPSLLTQRKSQVYSVLERESAVVSAYEGMGSDNELKPESDSSVGAALQEIHRKMMDSNINLQDTCNRILSPIINRRGSGDRLLSPMLGRRGSRDSLLSDSEGNWKPNKPLLGVIKMKVPAEIRRPSSRRTSIIDVNFNMEGAHQEGNKGAAEPDVRKAERSLMKMIDRDSSSVENLTDNLPSDALTPDTGSLTTPEPLDLENDITGQIVNQIDQELTLKLEQLASRVHNASTGEEKEADDEVRDADNGEQREEKAEENEEADEDNEPPQNMETESDDGKTEDEEKEEESKEEYDEEMSYRLNKLITKSRLAYFSSAEDELDKVSKSEEEEAEEDEKKDVEEEQKEQGEENMKGFTYKLCQLEKEVRANQFSSTEDEMDRVGVDEKTAEEEEKGNNVELAVKVCRLAYQANANQFSSTEDELDSAGLVEEDATTGEDGKKEELALKVCRLAHQVNASQFSSTEDELDRVGRGEEEEGTDEEALWKEQAEKAVQAAHLRDLASLVGPSSEDHLDKAGGSEKEVDEVTRSGKWEDAEGNHQDKEESFEDLDVNMFDLRDEVQEKKENNEEGDASENALVEQKTDSAEGCEVSKVADQEKESDERQEVELKDERMEEMKVQEENQPEEKRQEEEKSGESNGSVESWETADEERSEEYAEFDKIISSMLMMTLEDMQAPMERDEEEENKEVVKESEEVQEEEKTEGEGGAEQVEAEGEKESVTVQVQVDEGVKSEENSGLEDRKVEEEENSGRESGLEDVKVEEAEQIEEKGELEQVKVDGAEKVEETDGEEQVTVDEEVNVGEQSGLEEEKVSEEVKLETESVSEHVKEEETVKEEEDSGLENVKVGEKVHYWSEIGSEKVKVEEAVKGEGLEQVKPNEQVKTENKRGLENVKVDEKVKMVEKSGLENIKVDEKVKILEKSGLENVKVDEKVNYWREIGLEQGKADEEVKTVGKMGLEHVKVDERIKTVEKSRMEHLKVDEKVKVVGKSLFKEHLSETQSSDALKETESKKKFQSPSNNVTPESATKESPKVNILRKEESEVVSVKKESELQKKDPQVISSPSKKSTVMSIKEMLETYEAKQLCKRIGLHDDKQEDRGGKVSAMRQMMEAHGDFAEVKGKKADSKEHSRRSSLHDILQTPEEIQMRYSAVSLRNITTEVLKVLNTTEDLLQGVTGEEKRRPSIPSLPPNTDPKKLDQQFSKLEENVYVAAGSVYSLEAELGDLEECARSISGATSDMEISFLEEQVASAAAKVQQSDLQICDISARIAALKNAGLNVDTQSRPTKPPKAIPVMPVTLDSSRQFRRRLPAPPVKDKES
ncbi:uncharacterized protein myripa isoform X2 [Halichoeres trimaculatus]|uniref:uncharacterized protein myripa isoform X2 n=1 Tax=Halichoeres trimaculatus TaxID=147232 RepID=UPI003D9EC524